MCFVRGGPRGLGQFRREIFSTLGLESEKASQRRQCLNCHGSERIGRILIDREWGGRIGHSLHRQWVELRHKGEGEIRLMYFNREAEIKKDCRLTSN